MVKYTLEMRIFLYDSYVKKKSYKSCKRRFRRRYPGVRIPASLMIFRLVKKVRSTGSFLDKKYTRQNAVLTEETLDEIRVRLKHSPRKSLARLAQQAPLSNNPHTLVELKQSIRETISSIEVGELKLVSNNIFKRF
jgi:hypothetical protein